MKVYIELVLLDNFWADALVLFGTAKWMQAPYRKGRLFASAGLGTLYAVLSLMRGLVFLQHPLWKIAVSLLMVWAAFGFGSKKRFLRYCGVFWLFSLLLAAGVQLYGALFGQTRASGGALTVSGPPLWAFLLFSWGAGALALWGQRTTKEKAAKTGHACQATVQIGQTQAEGPCLLDSGHALYCPVSGLPVLFWPYDGTLEHAAVAAALQSQPLYYVTAAGAGSILAYRPCTLTLCREGRAKTVRCAVAFSTQLGKEALYPAGAAIGYFEEE